MGRVLPILFNSDMVRAILDVRKIVTRRIAKNIPIETHRIEPIQPFAQGNIEFECHWGGYAPDMEGFVDGATIIKPPYQPGDTMYVRETWAFLPCVECMREGEDCGRPQVMYEDKHSESEGCFVYRADHPHPDRVSWTPSIHMPKEAARIWLRVTDVRVERLQDITIESIRAEGLSSMAVHAGDMDIAIQEWQILWNSTIKKPEIDLYGWDANPWVWVIEFEPCEKPEISR